MVGNGTSRIGNDEQPCRAAASPRFAASLSLRSLCSVRLPAASARVPAGRTALFAFRSRLHFVSGIEQERLSTFVIRHTKKGNGFFQQANTC